MYINDLLLDFDNKRSCDFYKRKGLGLTWTGLRLSVPKELRSFVLSPDIDPIIFKHNNIQFDTYTAKCKQFYKLLITSKAKLPNMSKQLISDFDVPNSLQQILTHFHTMLPVKLIFGPSNTRCLIIFCTQTQNLIK